MIGLNKLQLFSPPLNISSEGKDFYAPLVRSFGSFYSPSQIPPEGGYETFEYLSVDLNINSENNDTSYIYRGVYIEGIINPILPQSPYRNLPFFHYVLYTWDGNVLNNFELIENINPFLGESPLSGNGFTVNNSSFSLDFNIDLSWVSTPQDDPLFKISGIYYTI